MFRRLYTHIFNSDSVANIGFYLRRDTYNYYPSNNPFADYALDQQQETISQVRTLTNMGVHADISYVHGVNNAKLGGMYEQTFLRENDNIGLVDPRSILRAWMRMEIRSAATSHGATPNPNYNPVLAPYDLTQGGRLCAGRANGCEATGVLWRGPDHSGQLDVQPGYSRRLLQRADHSAASRAACWGIVQREEDEDGVARELCADAGDAVQ